MNNPDDIRKHLNDAYELLNDFSRLIHLVTSDDPTRKLAKLRQTLGHIISHLNLDTVKNINWPTNKSISDSRQSKLVKIKPVGTDKTYIGFYIGDIATGVSAGITETDLNLQFSNFNPAIFVPELGRVVFGYESWWGEIESPEELTDITQDDIENVWYVQALKAMSEESKPNL